jgi:AsmA protein
MNKKYLFIVLSICFCLLLVVVWLLPFTLDPNHYKAEIAAYVEKKSGYKINLGGDVSVTFLPNFNLTLRKVTITNSSELLRVESASIGFAWQTLIDKQLLFDTVSMDGLSINLIKDQQGNGNWQIQEPVTGISAKRNRPQLKMMKTLSLRELTVSNASVYWQNQQDRSQFDIKKVNLNAYDVRFNHPFKATLSALVANESYPNEGTVNVESLIRVDPDLSTLAFLQTKLKLTGFNQHNPGINSHLDTLLLDLNDDSVTLDKWELQTGDHILLLNDLKIKNLLTRPFLSGELQTNSVNPKIMLTQWGVDMPRLQNKQALSKASCQLTFNYSPEKLVLDNVIVHFDQSELIGNLELQNINQPDIKFEASIDTLNLNDYFFEAKAISSKTKSSQPFPFNLGQLIKQNNQTLTLDQVSNWSVNGILTVDKLTIDHLKAKNNRLHIESHSNRRPSLN